MQEILNLIHEMSPYLLLGFGIAGVMHTFVPTRLYHRYLSGRGFRSVLYAAALGVPLPLCSCGVLPTAMSLRREGASKGATTSFLIATPQTGVDSIAATYSLMGLPFAIIRPTAALVTALMGGMLVNLFDRDKEAAEGSVQAETSMATDAPRLTLKEKFLGALRYGYVEMMQDIGRWLVIGLLVAGIITVAVPDGFFATFAHRPLLGMLLVLACSIPMYLCATGSIPIAVALMLKGMTPGTALVLLMAGPAVNVASVLVIRKVLGRRTLWLYLAAIVSGALAFALFIDYLLPREWFTESLTMLHGACHGEGTSWFNLLCTIILLLLLIYALISRLRGSQRCGCSSGCGDDACDCSDDDTPHHCSCGGACHEETPCCNADATPQVQTLTVIGMRCNHCRENVIRAISTLPGTENVDADLASGLVTVTGSTPTEEIIRTIESLGFEVKKEE